MRIYFSEHKEAFITAVVNEIHEIEVAMGRAGDFNADPSRGRLWDQLLHFVNHNQLTVNDLTLPIDSISFLSPAHNTTSWLDNIISSSNSSVSNVKIHYTVSLFLQFPLLFSINVTGLVGVNN